MPHMSICRLLWFPSCFRCTWIRSTLWPSTAMRRMQPWKTLKGFLHSDRLSSSAGQPEVVEKKQNGNLHRQPSSGITLTGSVGLGTWVTWHTWRQTVWRWHSNVKQNYDCRSPTGGIVWRHQTPLSHGNFHLKLFEFTPNLIPICVF